MNKHLLLATIFLVVGFVLICLNYFGSSYNLVIKGTHVSFGWFLIALGVIRLIFTSFKSSKVAGQQFKWRG